MLRQLLTVLVLLTGFGAAAEPARAPEATISIACDNADGSSASCLEVCTVRRATTSRTGLSASREAALAHNMASGSVIPSVRLQVDRAHE